MKRLTHILGCLVIGTILGVLATFIVLMAIAAWSEFA